MRLRTRFCQLCAKMEGFGIPGKVPTTHHNPLDLRHSPHSQHTGDQNAIGQIDTDAHGWDDAERQAQLWADRGLTLQEAIEDFLAPPSENNSAEYLEFVRAGLGVSNETPMTEVLKIPAVQVVS